MPRLVLILAGGSAPTPDLLRAFPAAAMCIAADSGLDHARALGLRPDLVIGDLDSADPANVAWAAEQGIEIERHPRDKDQTDLELALGRALALDPDRIAVAGIGGGRMDHLLANVAVLAHPRFAGPAIDGLIDGSRISVVHDHRTVSGEPGGTVSLLPVHGDAVGVTTTGLVWPLRDETLVAGTSRGVSNLFAEPEATIEVRRGTLLAVVVDGDRAGPPP